jgi:anaerobic selenocysteine-containing dehydrogenase
MLVEVEDDKPNRSLGRKHCHKCSPPHHLGSAAGAKVVTIDVRRTKAAAQSDEVLLIRPGTDAALALAVMHVIIT